MSVESNGSFRVQVSKVWLYVFNCIKSVESNVSFRVQVSKVSGYMCFIALRVWKVT